MEPEVWAAIGMALVGAIGGVGEFFRRRHKKAADSKRTIVAVDGSTGAEDTGRFIVAMKEAPAETLEDVARSLREIAGQKPATRDDLRSTEQRIRSDMTRHNEAYSDALVDLRNDVGNLQNDVGTLQADVGKLKLCHDAEREADDAA